MEPILDGANRCHPPNDVRKQSLNVPSSLATTRCVLVAVLGMVLNWNAGSVRAGDVSFTRDVRPILSEYCFTCHGPDADHRKADLRLDARESAMVMIEVGDPEASELWRRMASNDPESMMPPPGSAKRPSQEQLQTMAAWIKGGANWDNHWSLDPLVRPPVPKDTSSGTVGTVRNPIDAFVQDLQRRNDLQPSPEADRATLLRRLSLDLTGLPPTPHEAEVFFKDARPDAYERLVDRLLQSPAFGERMAWDWLDAARYADSNGYQGDNDRTMWPWRDWVVSAMNQDLPFDRFTVEQLAGDLLPDATFSQRLATGFCRNHMINGEGGRIPEENRIDYGLDMTETMGTVWLGLTLNCCRCHDHKFDPLSRRDYYQFLAFFNQTPVDGSGGDPQTKPHLEVPSEHHRRRRAELQQAIELARKATETTTSNSAAPSLETLENQLKELDASIPKVMIMEDRAERRQTFMLTRGLYNQPEEPVEAAVPQSLPALARSDSNRLPNRLDLAQWLVDSRHPLTARVTVNRYWQQLFGVGLVKTTEDFGSQGEVPIQRELLDWLAYEFRDNQWDIKHLVRTIVTSHTYRQASRGEESQWGRDPENRYLCRGPRFRMPYWMVRDQALAVSGLLVDRLHGPPVRPYQPAGVWEETSFGNKKYVVGSGEDLYRRSLYTFWRRIVAPTMFFDNASRQTCTVKVIRTNTPLQSLFTLNDVTFVEAARALAQRALRPTDTSSVRSDAERLDWLFQRVLVRRPTPRELDVLLHALQRTRTEYQADPASAESLVSLGALPRDPTLETCELASWTSVSLSLLNLDETLTKE